MKVLLMTSISPLTLYFSANSSVRLVSVWSAGGHAINLIIGGNLVSKWVAETVHLLLNQFPPRVKPTERSSHSIIKEKIWRLTEREKNKSEIRAQNLPLQWHKQACSRLHTQTSISVSLICWVWLLFVVYLCCMCRHCAEILFAVVCHGWQDNGRGL